MAIKGYWKFNGNSNDYSGNGNNGTDTGITYGQSYGIIGQGANFNGTTGKIVMPSGLIQFNSLTIGLRLRHSGNFRSTNGPGECIFTTTTTSARSGITIFGQAHYITAYNVTSTGTWQRLMADQAPGTLLTDGKFHDLFFSFDNVNKVTKFWLDSVLINTTSFSSYSIAHTSSSLITIGDSYDSFWNGNYIGQMDEVILYDQILTPAPIKNELSRIKGFF